MQLLLVYPKDLDDNLSIQENYQLYIATNDIIYDKDDILIECQSTFPSKPNSPYAPILTMYKQVDKKVKPVSSTCSQDAHVLCHFPHDPFASMTPLTPNPPKFMPNGRLTYEYIESLNINSSYILCT